MMNKKIFVVASLLSVTMCMAVQAPYGLIPAYDSTMMPSVNYKQHKAQFHPFFEIGYEHNGYNVDGDRKDALQVYGAIQNAFGLGQGGHAKGSFVDFLRAIGVYGAHDNNQGLFEPTGTIKAWQASLGGSYEIAQDLYVRAYVPFYTVRLSDVAWKHKGSEIVTAGAAGFGGVHTEENFVQSFQNLAQDEFGLNLYSWEQSGLGDVAILCDWQKIFVQHKDWIRRVQTRLRLGLTLPTGRKADTSLLLHQSFGADGTASVPFGAGIDVLLGKYVQLGASGQFTFYWNNTIKHRIKNFYAQTDLLLPVAADVYKKHGAVQQFSLYAQAYNVYDGFSLKCMYQYFRRGKSEISDLTGTYDHTLMNELQVLKEQTQHNILFELAYDSTYCIADQKTWNKVKKRVHPQFKLFWKYPFKGSNVNAVSTFGAGVSVAF